MGWGGIGEELEQDGHYTRWSLSIWCQLEKNKADQESSCFRYLGRKNWVHCLGVDGGLKEH